LAVLGLAQESGPLTDSSIMQLAKNGMPTSEIISVIRTAPSVSFDLSPSGTDRILQAGISESVIKAMAAREDGSLVAVSAPARPEPGNGSGIAPAPVARVSLVFPEAKILDRNTQTVSAQAAIDPVEAASGFSRIPQNSKLYIVPDAGFDTFLTAALTSKHVPLIVVSSPSQADYVVESTSDSEKAPIRRVIWYLGSSTEEASVRIVKVSSGDIVWAYAVNKKISRHGKQSSAEACAKHLKKVVS
jgi:hypothetical protein